MPCQFCVAGHEFMDARTIWDHVCLSNQIGLSNALFVQSKSITGRRLSISGCSLASCTHTAYMVRYCFHFASVPRSLPTDIPLYMPTWHVTRYEARRAKVYSPMHLAESVYLISSELHWSYTDIPLELTCSGSSIKANWPVPHLNMRASP